MRKIWNGNSIDKYKNTDTSIIQLFLLNIKTVYSTKTTKTLVIFSPIIVSFSLSIMLPIYYYVGLGQIFTTTLSSGIIWGMTYFSLRKSALYKNILISNIKRWEIYFSILLTMFFVTFFSQITFWTSAIIFDSIGYKTIGEMFLELRGDFNVNWAMIDWVTIVYTWILAVVIMFLVSFITREIFNSSKYYFIVLLVYVIFLVPFSNLFRLNFQYVDENIIVNTKVGFVFIVSSLFPQSHINNMVFVAVSSGVEIMDENTGLTQTFGNIEKFASFKWSTDWKWDLTIVYPPLALILLTFTSIMTINFFY